MDKFHVTFWSGATIERGVCGREAALALAQERANATGRTTAVYPLDADDRTGERIARCDAGAVETYEPDHWAKMRPATMGQRRAKVRRFRLAYFGWSIEFTSALVEVGAIRAEANRKLIEKHGTDPKPLGYVEPGLPFPAYVPVDVWEGKNQGFQPYL